MGYLFIILINLIYLPAIKFGLVSDDSAVMKIAPFNIKRVKWRSIILHIIIAEYIYLAFGVSQVSLIAALLFSIHPLTIQITCWRGGEQYGMNALILLMCIAFAPFAMPLYFLGALSIGTLLFSPLVFIFTKYWYCALIFPVIVLLSYKHIKSNFSNKVKGDGEILHPVLQKDFALHIFKLKNIILAVKTFGYYSLASLLPMKNGFYNSFMATLGSSQKATNYWYSLNRHFWGGLLAIVIISTTWWFNRFNFIGMGLLLFILPLIPFLNFITAQQFTTSRYAYLPLIGFQVALVGLIFKLPIIPQSAILGALALFYLDRTLRVMQHYKTDNITMIILDSQVFPDNPRVWYFRYEHMLHKNNPVMAWAEASYGLKYLPEDCQLWFGLAVASYDLGDLNAASEFLKKSEEYMILAERTNMEYLIVEFKQRIQKRLEEKYRPKRRF